MGDIGVPHYVQDKERRFKMTLALSADSPEQLRACDVDRVLSEAHDLGQDYFTEFKAWLLSFTLQGRTCAEVTQWEPE